MKNRKIIIVSPKTIKHYNLIHIYKLINPKSEFISYHNQKDGFKIFKYYHFLTKRDKIFLDSSISKRIIHILTKNVKMAESTPQIFLTTTYNEFDSIVKNQINKLQINFFPNEILTNQYINDVA